MSITMYRKIFSNLAFTIVFSAVVSSLFFKTQVYFSFLLVFFSFGDLLISWIFYLNLDGFTLPSTKGLINLLSKDNPPKLGNYLFSNRKSEKSENDEYVHLDISPRMYTKLTMWCYLASGIILMIISFIVYRV